MSLATNRRISPTRLRLYQECPTKYWYAEAAPKTQEQLSSVSHTFGKYAHKVAEWRLGRSPEDQSELERIIEECDKPKKVDVNYAHEIGSLFADQVRERNIHVLQVEVSHRVRIGQGYYDCQMDAIGQRNGRYVVVDHKTSIDPSKYAKREKELRKDLQCQLYAYALMDKYGVDEVDAYWHWAPRNRYAYPEHKTIETFISIRRSEVEAIAKKSCEDGQTLLSLSSRPTAIWVEDPLEILDTCDSYGGCPYFKRCMQDEGEDDMGLLSDLGLEDETPAPVNPKPENRPVTAQAPYEPLEGEACLSKADLKVAIAKCRVNNWDLETYLSVTYDL